MAMMMSIEPTSFKSYQLHQRATYETATLKDPYGQAIVVKVQDPTNLDLEYKEKVAGIMTTPYNPLKKSSLWLI